jgi:hypothetical protein
VTEDEAEKLRELSRDVRRLCPDRRDPEDFHIGKSEIAAKLAELAARLPPPAGRSSHHYRGGRCRTR